MSQGIMQQRFACPWKVSAARERDGGWKAHCDMQTDSAVSQLAHQEDECKTTQQIDQVSIVNGVPNNPYPKNITFNINLYNLNYEVISWKLKQQKLQKAFTGSVFSIGTAELYIDKLLI